MTKLPFEKIEQRHNFIMHLESIFNEQQYKVEFHNDTYLTDDPQVALFIKHTPYKNLKFIIDINKSNDFQWQNLRSFGSYLLQEKSDFYIVSGYVNSHFSFMGIKCVEK